jgi:uncharacterized protein
MNQLNKKYTSLSIRKITRLALVLFFMLFLVGCNNSGLPRPTKEYYVNDYANALFMKTRQQIVYEGEYLYDETKDIKTNGGAQIVVATFLIDDVSEIDTFESTELFRDWKIGKNDMGLLILLFFTEYEENEITYTNFEGVIVEMGYRMEQYMTPTLVNTLLNDSIYSEEWDWFIDVGLLEFIYLAQNEILVNAYQMEPFTYDMDEVYDYLVNGPAVDYDTSMEMDILYYLFSPYASFWEKAALIAPIILIMLGTGYKFLGNRGGGGSSGGFRIRRRR